MGIDSNVFLGVFVQQQLVICMSQVKGSEVFASSQARLRKCTPGFYEALLELLNPVDK